MHALTTMTLHSFATLRRDKIFLPFIIMGLAVSCFAALASEWTMEGFRKVLFDIGVTGFYLTGTVVAVLWGTKAVIDAQDDGGMELELAAPIGRSTWLVGKFLGLCLSMVLFAVILTLLWQAIIGLSGYGWLKNHEMITFGFLLVGWLVISAAAVFFATVCSHAVAQFATASVWIIGMTIDMIAKTMLQGSNEVLRAIVEVIAKGWDLQQFNLIQYASNPDLYSEQELLWRLLYGGLLVAILLSASCWTLSRRKIIG